MSEDGAPLSARLQRFSQDATAKAQDMLRKVSFERRTKVVKVKAEEAYQVSKEIVGDFKASEPKFYPCCFLQPYPVADGSPPPEGSKPPYLQSSVVVPEQMRRGSSDVSQYDNRELPPNLAVQMMLKAPADVLMSNFRDLFRVCLLYTSPSPRDS